jgi:GntR family trehalose operon transcriptional repressor
MNNNKFLQIYNDYLLKIKSGSLKPGQKLPSENDLVKEYETSRETVRKSLNLLAQGGNIHKIKGKGSFVLDMDRMSFPLSGLVSFKEMSQRLGISTKTLVYKTEQIDCPLEVARHLQVEKGEPIWSVIRAREIDGERIILDKDYFLASIVPMMTQQIATESIYDYLEQTLSLKIGYATKEISVDKLTEEDKKYLDLLDDGHIVVVRNYVHLEDTTLFQYTESRHRLDKFKFVEFARRVKEE